MKARTAPIVLLLVLSAAWSNDAIAADTSQVLVLEREIPLDRVSGRIDHMAIDLERRHLAVAELGNNTVDLIDLKNSRVMNRISGLDEPQGIAFVPSSDLFAVASGGDGSVKLFKGSDFFPAGVITLGDDADNVRLNRAAGHIVVGYGQGGLAVIDPITHSKLADIALRAHPEGFQISSDGSRAFVNVPALLDTQNGAITADVETCGDSDDVFFDDRRARIYVSCGAGVVDVFEHSDGGLRRVAQVKTYSGARTSLFVPELDRLFVASRSALLGNDAKIMVFRPSP